MSDYVPPENPYDAPEEEGTPAPGRSPWTVVLIVVAVVLVAGLCLCGLGSLSWFMYADVQMPPAQVIVEPVPADKAGEFVPALPADTDEP